VAGRELANLLPLPRTEAVAESIIAKVRTVQSRVAAPFLLENISYVFEWPELEIVGRRVPRSDPAARPVPDSFSISRTSILKLIESRLRPLRLPRRPAGRSGEGGAHGGRRDRARGISGSPFLADSHSHPMPDAALGLLRHALRRQTPSTIILERDDRLDAVDEILDDVLRMRACVAAALSVKSHGETAFGSAG